MNHWELIVTYAAVSSTNAKRRAKMAAGRLKLCHPDMRSATVAAEVLSGMQGVERVTMTRVREDSEGVWRKGRKS